MVDVFGASQSLLHVQLSEVQTAGAKFEPFITRYPTDSADPLKAATQAGCWQSVAEGVRRSDVGARPVHRCVKEHVSKRRRAWSLLEPEGCCILHSCITLCAGWCRCPSSAGSRSSS